MTSKQIRISEKLYARIEAEKRPDESYGEALERMVDEYSLLDFADDVADASDAWDTEALEGEFEASDRRNRAELEEELP